MCMMIEIHFGLVQSRACYRLIQSMLAAKQRTPMKDRAVFS